MRIDVGTGVLDQTIDLPFTIRGESSVAVGEDGVWMLSEGTQPELVRIDPTTNAVADTLLGAQRRHRRAGRRRLPVDHAGRHRPVDPGRPGDG